MAYYVIAYDIASNRRRKKVSDTLEAYGKRVNYSVFELNINSKAELKNLESKLLDIINIKIDSLRVYHLCQNCVKKSWSLGNEPAPFEQNSIYFF